MGLDRKTATEFSFFLAIPTMFAATLYDLLKNLNSLSAADIPVFGAGFTVAFIAAMLVIRAFPWFRYEAQFFSIRILPYYIRCHRFVDAPIT